MRYIVFILPVAMIIMGLWILLQYFSTGAQRDLLFGIGGVILGALFFMRRLKTFNKY